MNILPVAFESLGVRSMATFIETKDIRIFIDPGVSVSPDRYSLPPHRIELDRRREMLQEIKKWVTASDVVIITHYHYDHHNPDELCLYENKDVLLKHPRENINQSQKQRAATLLGMIEHCAHSIHMADGQEFTFGNTHIIFSPPVLHGTSMKLGYVIEVMIETDKRILYTSDVQGPLDKEALDFMIEMRPDIMILDGPPTYLVGSHYKKSDIHLAMSHIKQVIEKTSIQTIIIDHHLLRDIDWRTYVDELNSIKSSTRVCSAAEYLGKQIDVLEARRQELYSGVIRE